VRIGLNGLAPALLVPWFGCTAARSPFHAALLALVLPLALALVHRAAVRARQRSHLFVSWTLCSVVYTNLTFTLCLGPKLHFGAWLVITCCFLYAAVCAAEVRAAVSHPYWWQATAGRDARQMEAEQGQPLRRVSSCSDCSEEEAAVPVAAPGADVADAAPRCSLCGASVAGYDHHCIWCALLLQPL
jgi:hypothetical protein